MRKIRRYLLAIPVVLLCVPAVASAGTLDQSQTTTNQTFFLLWSSIPVAQTFTAAATGDLDQVDLLLSGTSGVTVEIKATSAGTPSGGALATASVPASSVPSSADWVSVAFGTPASVVAGTQYAIVVTGLAEPPSRWWATYSLDPLGGAYVGGHIWQLFSAWSPGRANDTAFKTYVVPTDRDGDGVVDTADGCPNDPAKTSQTTYYADADGDGYGDANVTTQACNPPSGYVVSSVDHDDADAGDFPGAPEECNGDDEDGDGVADDGVTTTYYADADGDGYGDESVSVQACAAPAGYVSRLGDNCALVANATQLDSDQDGRGDVCDAKPFPLIDVSLRARVGQAGALVKDAISARGGDVVFFEAEMYNEGDVPLTQASLDLAACDAGSRSSSSGDANNNGLLDPGEVAKLRCSRTITAADRPSLAAVAEGDAFRNANKVSDEGRLTVNVAAAPAPAEQPQPDPDATPQGGESAQVEQSEPARAAQPAAPASQTATVSATPQAEASRGPSGTARLFVRRGCRSGQLRLRVLGANIAKVTFFVDGRRIGIVPSANARNEWRTAVRKLSAGKHRIGARVTYTTGQPGDSFKARVARC